MNFKLYELYELIFMENKHSAIESLVEKAEAFGKTSFELYKLKALDKSSDVLSSLVVKIAVILIALLFITVLNIGISMWLGQQLGKIYHGFFVVAGFYAMVGIIVFLFRQRLIKKPVSNSIILDMMN